MKHPDFEHSFAEMEPRERDMLDVILRAISDFSHWLRPPYEVPDEVNVEAGARKAKDRQRKASDRQRNS